MQNIDRITVFIFLESDLDLVLNVTRFLFLHYPDSSRRLFIINGSFKNQILRWQINWIHTFYIYLHALLLIIVLVGGQSSFLFPANHEVDQTFLTRMWRSQNQSFRLRQEGMDFRFAGRNWSRSTSRLLWRYHDRSRWRSQMPQQGNRHCLLNYVLSACRSNWNVWWFGAVLVKHGR